MHYTYILWDHPGLVLRSSPWDESNFLAWLVELCTFCAKLKLGFIDDSSLRPTVGLENFEQWRRVDLMSSWIWNSIANNIVEGFMCTASACDLWLDLKARYGSKN
ncbi:UNVERIFIED_CONTAM: hypothetical protein Sradi_3871000 [Sesamum radiatum]|uniref:Retrotransposon Copia-like N-terminal domain-containing protein n=1 Tax=Sesamum radiatum TaxID=300843 RepID=A0AAW2Q1Y6_SESRA